MLKALAFCYNETFDVPTDQFVVNFTISLSIGLSLYLFENVKENEIILVLYLVLGFEKLSEEIKKRK